MVTAVLLVHACGGGGEDGSSVTTWTPTSIDGVQQAQSATTESRNAQISTLDCARSPAMC